MSDKLNQARANWGTDLPDWVEALARACDETSQNMAAKAISRSAALVSTVISRSYKGNMALVEQAVRAGLMRETVKCPALGLLPLSDCLKWRIEAKHFKPVNTSRVTMFRACRKCPLNKQPEKNVEGQP